MAAPEAEYRQTYTFAPGSGLTLRTTAGGAIRAETQQWTHIPVPALAIFAVPKVPTAWTRENRPDYFARVAEEDLKQSEAFEKGVPTARVVRIANAHHYVFLSNESDVLREMRIFLSALR